jgi:hypothetical protein
MAVSTSDGWTVWGDAVQPKLVSSEEAVKAYVKERSSDSTLYISSPDGTEYGYESDTDSWEEL